MNDQRSSALRTTAEARFGRREMLRLLLGTGLGLAITSAGLDRATGRLTGPPPAAATELQTGVCYPPSDAIATGSGNGRLAETFVASTAGKLSRVQLDVNKPANTTGDYLVQLLAVDAKGKPTNKVLAKARIYDSDVAVGTTVTINAHFRKRKTVALKAGKRYAMAVSRPGPNGILVNSAINGCVDDRMFHSDSQTDPFIENSLIDLRVAIFVGF